MAVRRIVVAKHRERAHDGDALGIGGHQHHALLRMAGCLGVRLAHHDVDGAAWVTRARGPPLAAVDDVFVAIALNAGGNVRGIAGGDIGLGHGKGRADLAF